MRHQFKITHILHCCLLSFSSPWNAISVLSESLSNNNVGAYGLCQYANVWEKTFPKMKQSGQKLGKGVATTIECLTFFCVSCSQQVLFVHRIERGRKQAMKANARTWLLCLFALFMTSTPSPWTLCDCVYYLRQLVLNFLSPSLFTSGIYTQCVIHRPIVTCLGTFELHFTQKELTPFYRRLALRYASEHNRHFADITLLHDCVGG